MPLEHDKDMSRKNRRMGDIIKEIEGEFFIGRNPEIGIFKKCIQSDNQDVKLLHIYGAGGVGKTFLLNEYSRFAEGKGILFFKLDSQDYTHTPQGFMEYLLILIQSRVAHILIQFHEYSLQNTFQVLNEIAATQRIVIAIDTYEHMANLDHWFRQVFVRYMHPNIIVVLAGRQRLTGEWEESPAWRKVTKQIELQEFNLLETYAFLSQYGIGNDQLVRTMWQFTRGHPLTLFLLTVTNEKFEIKSLADQLSENTSQILIDLTERWLREVKNEELHHLIEIAAFFHRFDQKALSTIYKQEVSLTQFKELISLSFIRFTHNGWAMHDLIKDAVKVELKHRNSDRYQQLCGQMANYFYRRVIATRDPDDMAQFFYHLGDQSIQSTFFLDSMDTSMYLEPIGAYNFHEVMAFFKHKKSNLSKSEAAFYNRETNKTFHFHASLQHNRKESELLGVEYIEKMGYGVARLLKNECGETLGLSIIVPINQYTLKHLSEEPVSQAYFTRITEKERKAYAVPDDQVAGWFIRMLDFTDSTDTSARSFLLYHLFPKLLSGGKVIVSTPLPFYQDLLKNFGFKEVAGATHFDYGENAPSPSYLLDVSGSNLAVYLKQFTNGQSQDYQMDMITDTLSLTEREVDIIKLIMAEKSNVEIANELFVAEITVKKHVSRILKKAKVLNRTQLIKRIMELI